MRQVSVHPRHGWGSLPQSCPKTYKIVPCAVQLSVHTKLRIMLTNYYIRNYPFFCLSICQIYRFWNPFPRVKYFYKLVLFSSKQSPQCTIRQRVFDTSQGSNGLSWLCNHSHVIGLSSKLSNQSNRICNVRQPCWQTHWANLAWGGPTSGPISCRVPSIPGPIQ